MPLDLNTLLLRVPEPTRSRLYAKIRVLPGSQCWLWTAAVTKTLYGTFRVDRVQHYVHRFFFALANGPIPRGWERVIDHRCRTMCCCNPAHMELVTVQVNTKRGRRGDVRS